MNDKDIDVNYCEREPYNRSSSCILISLSINDIQNDIELDYLAKYKRLFCEYLRTKNQISVIENYKLFANQVNKEENKLEKLKLELAKLESSKPIQNILIRNRKFNENIHMDFGKSDNFLSFYIDAKKSSSLHDTDEFSISSEDAFKLSECFKNINK